MLSWLRRYPRVLVLSACVLLIFSLVAAVSVAWAASRAPRVSAAVAASVTVPTIALPWDKSLNGTIPFTGGPHAGLNPSCAAEPVGSMSGVDFGFPENTDVLAVTSGRVIYAKDYGDGQIRNAVMIDHGGGFITEYWHLNSIDPSIVPGVWVSAGSLLGKSGWSPDKDGNKSIHLHLEFRQYTSPPSADPLGNIPYPAQGLSIDGYTIWTFVDSKSGNGLNYEGTMTRSGTISKAVPQSKIGCGGKSQAIGHWEDVGPASRPKDCPITSYTINCTIIADSSHTGGYPTSTNLKPLPSHFQFSPTSVNLTTTSGQNPTPQTLTLTDTGLGPLTWTLTSTPPSWLGVSPVSGFLSPITAPSQDITLTFTMPTTPGTYTTSLEFRAPGADNSPTTVPISVSVALQRANTWVCSNGNVSGLCSASTIVPMPTARADMAVVTAPDGRIFALGGSVDTGPGTDIVLSTVEAYDPVTNTWKCSIGDTHSGCASTTITPMPTARTALAAVLGPNGLIYAIGGYSAIQNGSGGSAFNTVEAYDPVTNTWQCSIGDTQSGCNSSTLMPMNTATVGSPAVVAPGGLLGSGMFIYVFDGQTDTEAYDIDGNQWVPVAPSPARESGAGAVLGPNNHIYLLGTVLSPVVRIYDVATGQWSASTSPMPTARSYYGTAVGPDGRFYTIGGDIGIWTNIVEAYTPGSDSWSCSTNDGASGCTSSTITPMPTPRFDLGSAVDRNGRIYAIGGGYFGDSNVVEVYST